MLKRRSGIDARAFVFNAFIALKRLYGLIEALTVINDVKARVSRYMSYLLRHNPEDLELDDEGFVGLDELCTKVKGRYPTVDSKLLIKIVDESERKRFEIVDNKIRALYGHSI